MTALTDISARLDHIDAQLAYLVERQKKTEELFAEMGPILKEVMGTATTKLAALEEKGYFAMGKELANVGDRVLTGFTPDDVHQLGDAIVGILQTVRAMTQPKVLEIAGEASEVLENADKAEPIGLFGMAKATRDDDVQKGIAVMVEVMRHVGRAAHAVREQRKLDPAAEKKAKLAAVLGPRKKTVRAAPPSTPVKAAQPAIDPASWTRELAVQIAATEGITLDDARWAIIDFARAEFEKVGASPNIRRLGQGTNLATKDLYALFPKAPARTVARIAGIPKPAGCI